MCRAVRSVRCLSVRKASRNLSTSMPAISQDGDRIFCIPIRPRAKKSHKVHEFNERCTHFLCLILLTIQRTRAKASHHEGYPPGVSLYILTILFTRTSALFDSLQAAVRQLPRSRLRFSISFAHYRRSKDGSLAGRVRTHSVSIAYIERHIYLPPQCYFECLSSCDTLSVKLHFALHTTPHSHIRKALVCHISTQSICGEIRPWGVRYRITCLDNAPLAPHTILHSQDGLPEKLSQPKNSVANCYNSCRLPATT